jgi:hypothetical protein
MQPQVKQAFPRFTGLNPTSARKKDYDLKRISYVA